MTRIIKMVMTICISKAAAASFESRRYLCLSQAYRFKPPLMMMTTMGGRPRRKNVDHNWLPSPSIDCWAVHLERMISSCWTNKKKQYDGDGWPSV